MPVEFEENDLERSRSQTPQKSQSAMASWLIKHNLAKDESGANKILIALIIVCFALAAYFAFF